MADKKIKVQLKLVIQAGKANPAPPVGSALGPHGINLMQFCKEFNDKTSGMTGGVPAVVTVFDDRSFEFILKTAAVSELIKQALKIESGSGTPNKTKVGQLTKVQLREVAEKKMSDLNAYDVEQAMKIVAGTARSMGVTIEA
jgi:large subunit ribosomal protein L11